jgi:uncharacterized protein YjiS (DUF1127 family)
MPNLVLRAAHDGFRIHQKNWGSAFARSLDRWCHRWARHSERKVLRDLADNPHLLADIGVSREEALQEAERRIWDITDVYIHFL